MERSQLGGLKAGNVALDRRHDRRALSRDELDKIVAAARKGKPWHRVTGEERATLYTTAYLTGLRAGELASLYPSSFDLEAGVVVVEASFSKRRRKDTLPLHQTLLALLKEWLPTRPADQPVWWQPYWPKHASEMLQVDLAAAGVPFKDAKGFFADFHCLRHSYITLLVKSGVAPKLAQQLARHSTIRLTMDRYCQDAETAELREALSKLPA